MHPLAINDLKLQRIENSLLDSRLPRKFLKLTSTLKDLGVILQLTLKFGYLIQVLD